MSQPTLIIVNGKFMFFPMRAIDLFLLTMDSITLSTQLVSFFFPKNKPVSPDVRRVQDACKPNTREMGWVGRCGKDMYGWQSKGRLRMKVGKGREDTLIWKKRRRSIRLVVSQEWGREHWPIWDTNKSWHRRCSFNNGWFKGFLKRLLFFLCFPSNKPCVGRSLIRYRW